MSNMQTPCCLMLSFPQDLARIWSIRTYCKKNTMLLIWLQVMTCWAILLLYKYISRKSWPVSYPEMCHQTWAGTSPCSSNISHLWWHRYQYWSKNSHLWWHLRVPIGYRQQQKWSNGWFGGTPMIHHVCFFSWPISQIACQKMRNS